MVKCIALLKRKPGMTMEEFKVRWVDEHTKISSKMPRLRGYYCNVATAHQPNDGDPAYDGTAELWWDSVEDMEADFQSQEGILGGNGADSFLTVRTHIYTTEYTIVPFKGHS